MPKTNLRIATGTYFGDCFGYCNDELVLTVDGMVYTQSSPVASDELPDKTQKFPMPERRWNAVSKQIDWRVLNSLPERIGRPDEYDQGGEFLEVVEGDKRKRIDFDPESAPPEIKDLLESVRSMRRRAKEKASG